MNTMSQRMTMDEVLKEYGVPQIKLDIHATRSELLKLREKLDSTRAQKKPARESSQTGWSTL